MTKSGLDVLLEKLPPRLAGLKVGVLCHAASINNSYVHILDALFCHDSITIGAVFGPQHGLFGQTQDNMIEWEGGVLHPEYNVPVYSLYGKSRKPSTASLSGLDAFIVDLQDVGARPYTYIWTVKLCMEACCECGIPVWILDRPNPIGAVPFDGPMLNEEYFSFVGGARIPLCHRMTIGEIALLIRETWFPSLALEIVWMREWYRDSLFPETGLPWVLPSPNMPTVQTAIVYPGMVLLEATTISEGRGSTIPFELFGAPFVNIQALKKHLFTHDIPGCKFREHNFIPTFQKWQGTYCAGMQIHVTDPRTYQPVYTTVAVLDAIIRTAGEASFAFKKPPYEYEYKKMPFDILAGDDSLRKCLHQGRNISEERDRWHTEIDMFKKVFNEIAHYPEQES